MLVTARLPGPLGGHGKPQRSIASSPPSGPWRTTGAIWSGKILGSGGCGEHLLPVDNGSLKERCAHAIVTVQALVRQRCCPTLDGQSQRRSVPDAKFSDRRLAPETDFHRHPRAGS